MDVIDDINPVPGTKGYGTVLRALSTPFIEMWQPRRDEVRRKPERLRAELLAARLEGRLDALLPAAGQSAGLIREILPAGEIVRRLVSEAEQELTTTSARAFSIMPVPATPPGQRFSRQVGPT